MSSNHDIKKNLLPRLQRQNANWVDFDGYIARILIPFTVNKGVEVSLHSRPQTPAPLGGNDGVKLSMQVLVTLE